MSALAQSLRFGRFRLENLLGAGGMGQVYRARDLTLERTVALKILPPEVSADPVRRARLEREARLIASLNHPHVCAIYDVGFAEGVSFLVLEYLEGESLGARLTRAVGDATGSRSGPRESRLPSSLSLQQVLTWGAQMADALAAAHRQAIVHRDLKPDNVMIVGAMVKVLDFGLAQRIAEVDSAEMALSRRDLNVTAKLSSGASQLMGTLPYMAPEQFHGGTADARCDIFALGLVLYEMVTGHRAFPETTEAALISAILERTPPPLDELCPAVPSALSALVAECLAKNPEDRWQSAADIARILRQLASHPPVASKTIRAGPLWRRALPAIGAASLALVVAAGLGRALAPGSWRQDGPGPSLHFELSVPTLYGHPRISPDGKKVLVIVAGDGSQRRLMVRPLNANSLLPVPGTDGARFPFWSPDSREVGFVSKGKLRRVPILSSNASAPQVIAEHPDPFVGGTWGRDGRIVFVAGKSELYVVSAQGGTPVALGAQAHLEPGTVVGEPAFLPDGKHFLFFHLPRTRSRRGVMLASLEPPHRFQRLFVADTTAAFSEATGQLVYGYRCGLWSRDFSAERLQVSKQARLVIEQAACQGLQGRPFHSLSRNGTLIYRQSSGDNIQFTWFARNGSKLGTIGWPGQYLNFDLSPDDGRLVVGKRLKNSGSMGLWILDTNTEAAHELATSSDASDLTDPVWSADGRSVIYSDLSPPAGIIQQHVEGHLKKLLHRPEQGIPYVEHISRDGQWLAFLRWTEVSQVVQILRLDTREVRALGPPNSRSDEARFSPAGGLVAYSASHRQDGAGWQVYIERLPPAQGRWQVSSKGGVSPRWNGDGSSLFFLAPDGRLMESKVQVDGEGQPRFERPEMLHWTTIKPNGLFDQFAVSQDGQRFLLPIPVEEKDGNTVQVITNWKAGSALAGAKPATD